MYTLAKWNKYGPNTVDLSVALKYEKVDITAVFSAITPSGRVEGCK